MDSKGLPSTMDGTKEDTNPKDDVHFTEESTSKRDENNSNTRKSARESKPTEKMALYRQEELEKHHKRCDTAYDNWKCSINEIKKLLKSKGSESACSEMISKLQTFEHDVMNKYERLRETTTATPDIVRKVDTVTHVSRDFIQIIEKGLYDVHTFDPTQDNTRIKEMCKSKYASSVFSSTSSSGSGYSQLKLMLADAEADMAERKLEYEFHLREQEEKEKLAQLEIEREKRNRELKILEAKRKLEMSEARLGAYSRAAKLETEYEIHGDVQETVLRPDADTFYPQNEQLYRKPEVLTDYHVPQKERLNKDPGYSETHQLAKALLESMSLNRLPVPEPAIFTGNPLNYIEWKMSFEMLIDQKCIPPQEKLFYLKRYIGGPALKALEGFFISNSEFAYEKAREVLDERFGSPFVVTRAFRERLEKWPKIHNKDPNALRDFADFLKGCNDARLHVPGLRVLDDCSENQKLLAKLPDWALVRWNREVTESINITGNYPSFQQFVEYVTKEARIACNPISSLHAMKEIGPKVPDGKYYNKDKVKVLATSSSGGYSVQCMYCDKAGHPIYKCKEFSSLTIYAKRSHIRDKNLCYGCLCQGHVNKDCKRKHTCGICKLRHPTCLHEEKSPSVQRAQKGGEIKEISSLRVGRNNGKGTSMIVPVWVSSSENQSSEILTYAMLDTQSDSTFILRETADALRVRKEPVKLSLSTMTSQHSIEDSSRVCSLRVRGFNSPHSDAVVINNSYTRNFIPGDRSHIPQGNITHDWPHLQQIRNELPPLQSCEIGLLIGYNCPKALAPRKILLGSENEPYAVQTILGWSVVGYTEPETDTSIVQGFSCRTATKELPVCSPREVIKALEMDFAHEKGSDIKLSQNDIHFIDMMDKNICQRDDKHLEMPLPFKERPVLPNNKHLASLRLEHLKTKFQRDPRYYDHYKAFMEEILSRGDAELTKPVAKEKNVWYLPHHGVYHSKKPDKLRVVFDCSAKYRNESLNEHLLTGPDLTNGLAGVLCRFRRHKIGVMCDIEKMFHQFVVSEPDRDFLRFLWWEDGDVERNPSEYRMRVHLFGAASSPGCANYGLKYLANLQKVKLPCAASFVQNDFYVDDGLTSVESEIEAIELIRDSQQLCANGGLHLHKFASNSKHVIDSIPFNERSSNVKDLNLSLEKLPIERALGVEWSIEDDAFKFHVKIKDAAPTRRNMLSIVASVFDPLGFLSPFTLRGKKILQEMCQNGVGWDDPLPSCSRPLWEEWIRDIENLEPLRIPRCLKPSDFGTQYVIELHHFSDASSQGYGQCSYVRFVSELSVHCALLTSKARVAPCKLVTIPRLELTAAVLSVKMSRFLREELGLKINKEYFWTDSQVVLGYINNEVRRFHVFVANRIQIIREETLPSQWFYVNTEDNPADHASRGLSACEIANSSWLTGPPFLWQREIQTQVIDTELKVGDPEVRAVRTLHTTTTTSPTILDRIDRFSSWTTVVSVIARLQRLSNGIKGKDFPTVEERKRAERTIIQFVQQRAFSETIKILRTSGTLPNTHHMYEVDPILKYGLLCVGGRLRKAKFHSAFKHPVILPKDSHVTQLILAYVHQQTQHQGRGMTLNELRSRGFWILKGSKVVANFIRECVICRKLRRPTEIQKMADLPEDRVGPTSPFTYCGMDCFGPFLVKQGRKEVKRYGLIFTCMCSRAIHIEMLDDMTTDAFINGLRCFIAIRGSVRQIRSDQGSNFIGVRNEFDKEIALNKVTSYLTKKQCDFVFNAPNASHTGGVWERQIRTVRNILDSVVLLCPGRLDDSSLRTVFYEVMTIVNSRPLTVSEINDPKALEPLTPNHILTAKSVASLPPPGNFVKEDMYLRKRWRRVQYLLEQFWSRWKREYLNQISLRQRWHGTHRNIQKDDIVLVTDIDLPRCQWPLARVIHTNIDDDGLVRRVRLIMGRSGVESNILERSVHKLVLLVECV